VSSDSDDLTRIATELEEKCIDIGAEYFLKSARVQPFDHFGADEAQE
jgi:hypothetical protein